MTTPRSRLVDPKHPMHYHVTSRCVRKSFLCGEHNGHDFSHRKAWIHRRAKQLAPHFDIDIDAYAVMDNHFHLVLYYDPTACQRWSDQDVARRWVDAFPPKLNGLILEELKPLRRQQLLEDPDRLADRRHKLGQLSTFMKHVKQPVARSANREDHCTGHFFEQRFYSGALLDDEAVLATMVYVDLNPVRAKIADSVATCQNTSLQARMAHLANSKERLLAALRPLDEDEGIAETIDDESFDEATDQATDKPKNDRPRPFRRTGQDYLEAVTAILRSATGQPAASPQEARWRALVHSIGDHQRAHGAAEALTQWLNERGMRPIDKPLPA